MCVQDPRFDSILKKMRLGKRGTGGEASLSTDGTFDISNAERLGKSEVRHDDIWTRLSGPL